MKLSEKVLDVLNPELVKIISVDIIDCGDFLKLAPFQSFRKVLK